MVKHLFVYNDPRRESNAKTIYLSINLRHETGVLLLLAKIVLDELKGLLVDLLVLMALQVLDLVQATAFLHLVGVRIIAAIHARIMQAQFEYIVEAVQGHLDHFGVHRLE